MPTVTLPPPTVGFVRYYSEPDFPRETLAQGDAGRLLTKITVQKQKEWHGHSEYLARAGRQGDALDTPLGIVKFPLVKAVRATFVFIGKIQPTPVPDLDD